MRVVMEILSRKNQKNIIYFSKILDKKQIRVYINNRKAKEVEMIVNKGTDEEYKYDICTECGEESPMEINEHLCQSCRDMQDSIDLFNTHGVDYMLEYVTDRI